MKSLSLVLAGALSISNVLADNNDMVILVHGLGGSAETWDYRAELQDAGLETVAVEVNPFASNYDRACEVFAQLKGLRTDYGACHSDDNGHARYGPDFTGAGLYPDWGADRKVHLVGHSMGGLTIRHLERLLEEGSGCAADDSELFQGGNNWITSVSTFASPLDGTTIFDNVFGFEGILIDQFVATGIVDENNLAFPQWGLERGEDEDFDDFFDRVEDSGLFDEPDFCIEDMRVTGAANFNNAGKQVYDGRYYFSFATELTDPEEVCWLWVFCHFIQVPGEGMDEDLRASSSLIGRLAEEIDMTNDGIVNQQRQRCPSGDNCREVADGSTTWTAGQWHTIKIDFLDHFQIVTRNQENDANNFQKSARRLFLEHGLRLKALPSTSLSTRERTIEDEELEEKSHAKYLRMKRYIDAKKAMSTVFTEDDGLSKAGAVVGTLFIIFAIVGAVSGGAFFGKKKYDAYRRNKEVKEAAHVGGEIKADTKYTL